MKRNLQLPIRQASEHRDSAQHPAGSQARVLLTSVFGPYAQDDEYGSRALNPMELYQNQVTRTQGAFSLRMFHRSWGLMLIQANIQAPCLVLDFPTLDRFIQELQTRSYDIIGITAIPPNILKVKKMCALIRQYQPHAVIVVGGHLANVPNLDRELDADQIVRGEGVRWFRRFLGEDEEQPIRHPLIESGFGSRTTGITLKDEPGDVAATVIPSVGCPLGCNFCSTSAMFGGKGKHVDFYRSGDELFDIMCQLERELNVRSFFCMDENFLFHRRRALRLLELMEQHHKAWSLNVFSSANVLSTYRIDQLVRLGIAWVWMGIEGRNSQYTKLKNIDTFALIRELQAHGIRVLGSTIIGLENHTPENIDEVIEYAAEHATDFHQFMLYTPVAGTPLHAEMTAKGLMKDPREYHVSDIHGQFIFNYRHPHITDEQAAEFMVRAFDRDFQRNGPSTVRLVRTILSGYQRYKHDPNPCIRDQRTWEARPLPVTYSALVGAAKLYYRHDPPMRAQMAALQKDLNAEFGWKSWLASEVGGRWVLRQIRKEEQRLKAGWTYEPQTFYERNAAVTDCPEASLCQSVVSHVKPHLPAAVKPAHVSHPKREPVGV